MASSLSLKNLNNAPVSSSTEQYEDPIRTLLTLVDNVEVLCELTVDFESLQENGFNLCEDVTTQGWNKYFNRLLGPNFPILVKEFWIHATSSNQQVMSYVTGNKIVIIEDLIGKLIEYNGGGVRCIDMADKGSDLKYILGSFSLLDNHPARSET